MNDVRRSMTVLCDAENLVPLCTRVLDQALAQFATIMTAFSKFLAKNDFAINRELSVACVRRSLKLETRLAEILSPLGIRVLRSRRRDPAENALIEYARGYLVDNDSIVRLGSVMILSGDSDLLPTIQELKNREIKVGVIAWNAHTCRFMKHSATKFISLESMLRQVNVWCQKIQVSHIFDPENVV